MISTPIDAPATAAEPTVDETARRLVATEYSRHLVAGATHESLVEALHVRSGVLSADEAAWLRSWLATAVPRMTERTVRMLAAQLETALWAVPIGLIDRLEERRHRAALGVE